jgi:glutathione peroxidase
MCLLGSLLGYPAVAAPPLNDVEEVSMEWTKGLVRLDGESLDPSELEGKVVLVVNVASKCGFTGQYDGLQALWKERQDEGLVILGVPCNQFGSQEPGQPEEIVSFCRVNYGVDFPLLEKQNVNGSKRSDLYHFLVSSEAGGGKNVRWNFEKFVIDRSGKVVGRFGSMTKPSSSSLKAVLDEALGS